MPRKQISTLYLPIGEIIKDCLSKLPTAKACKYLKCRNKISEFY